jgi:hypothetical protein
MKYDDGVQEWTRDQFGQRGWYGRKIAEEYRHRRDIGKWQKRRKKTKWIRHHSRKGSRPVVCQDFNGHEHRFASVPRVAAVMARAFGRPVRATVIRCAIDNGQRSFGYFWRFADEDYVRREVVRCTGSALKWGAKIFRDSKSAYAYFGVKHTTLQHYIDRAKPFRGRILEWFHTQAYPVENLNRRVA